MACALTTDYDSKGTCAIAGGSSEVYIIESANISSYTLAADIVTVMTIVAGKKFRQYKIRQELISTSNALTKAPANGTFAYASKVDFSLLGFTTVMTSEIKLLAQNALTLIVKDNSPTPVYRIFGLVHPMDLLSASDDNEATFSGFRGNKLSFGGSDVAQAYEVQSSIIAALLLPAS